MSIRNIISSAMDLARDQKFNFGDEIASGIRLAKKQVCLLWKIFLLSIMLYFIYIIGEMYEHLVLSFE